VARRGFFAEIQYQNQLAAKRREQALRAASRQQAAAIRAAEQAQRQAERARNQAERASAAQQKEAQREAHRLHDESMQADAASRNAQLVAQYEEIDSILSAILDVDDFVDLEELRSVVQHPPFARTDLEQPIPAPPPLAAPPEPTYVEPDGAPKGLGGVFGGRKHYAERVAQAQAAFAQQHAAWQEAVAQLPAAQLRQLQEHQQQEQQRVEMLNRARQDYEAECQQRESAAKNANHELDALIAGLAANNEEAVQEYVSIVLSGSVYPECFPVTREFEFDSGLRELSLDVTVPTPAEVPSAKEFKYTKAKDEITASTLSLKERKERYANAVWAVALRTMHEVFEADRGGHIQTITLSVGVDGVEAATGRSKHTSLVAVASDRESFTTFDLAKVVPLATLQHLKALVSKNPFELVEIDNAKGVRGAS
jgi:restriction system protein